VVGASSGIGRAVALTACQAGARAVLAARRADALAAVADQAGDRAITCPCDVTSEADCERLADFAVRSMGGVDAIVYATGASPLVRIAEATRTDWELVLSTNLLGAARMVAALLPTLREEEDPVVVLVSSHSVGDPWPGLSLYATSKAALDELARGLRAEEAWLRVVRVAVGPTLTGFADAWDQARAAVALEEWSRAGLLRHEVQDPSYVASVVCGVLGDEGARADLRVVGGSVEPA
jgi:NAD(P)-dependent dehydrogenase (short-subunit alcohol dehydrogenase family)